MRNVLAEVTALDRSKVGRIVPGCAPAGFLTDTAGYSTIVGGVSTDFLAHIPQTTLPTATPANTWMPGRLAQPFMFSIDLFRGNEPGGRTLPGAGALQVDDPADELAGWRNYVWRGARLQLWPCTLGTGKTADPDDRFADLTVDGIDVDLSQGRKTLRLRTLDYLFNAPLLTQRYRGTGGDDGDVELLDQLQPMLLGYRYNIAPRLIDKVYRVYQVSCPPVPGDPGLLQVDAVRDGGSPLVFTADFPDGATLRAATLAVNEYATCLALGLIRTGGTAQRALTCDAQGGTYSSAATIINGLVSQFALKGRITPYTGFTRPFPAGLPSGQSGLYLTQSTTIGQAIDALLAQEPMAAYVGLDRKLYLWGFAAPAATPGSFLDFAYADVLGRPTCVEVPPRAGTLMQWGPNALVQGEGEVDPTLPVETKRLYSQVFRGQQTFLAAGGSAWADGPVVTVPSMLKAAADAAVQAQTWNALFGVPRQIWTVPVRWYFPDELNTKANLSPLYALTKTVRVNGWEAFGLSSAKTWRCVGLSANWRTRTLTMRLWG